MLQSYLGMEYELILTLKVFLLLLPNLTLFLTSPLGKQSNPMIDSSTEDLPLL